MSFRFRFLVIRTNTSVLIARSTILIITTTIITIFEVKDILDELLLSLTVGDEVIKLLGVLLNEIKEVEVEEEVDEALEISSTVEMTIAVVVLQ